MKFIIDEAFLISVQICTEHPTYDRDNFSQDDLINVLNNNGVIRTYAMEDHPEFTKLRNQLEELGYIQIQRNWWNGDIVTKSFTLNEYRFKKGQSFPCASALGISVQIAKKKNRKTLGLF